MKNLLNVSKTGTIDPKNLLTQLNKALTLLSNYTVNTLGQNSIYGGALPPPSFHRTA